MRFVLATRGSRGDVNPMIELATGLKRAGNEVLLCLPPLFASDAQARGLDCRFYGEDSDQLMRGFASGCDDEEGCARRNRDARRGALAEVCVQVPLAAFELGDGILLVSFTMMK